MKDDKSKIGYWTSAQSMIPKVAVWGKVLDRNDLSTGDAKQNYTMSIFGPCKKISCQIFSVNSANVSM